jgi:hypothetical protein
MMKVRKDSSAATHWCILEKILSYKIRPKRIRNSYPYLCSLTLSITGTCMKQNCFKSTDKKRKTFLTFTVISFCCKFQMPGLNSWFKDESKLEISDNGQLYKTLTNEFSKFTERLHVNDWSQAVPCL